MEIYKFELKEFFREMENFLHDDNKKTILIRGYFNLDKLKSVFYLINQNFNSKSLVLYTGISKMFLEGDIKKSNLRIQNQIDFKSTYRMDNNNSICFKKINKSLDFNNSYDFAIFYPVQLSKPDDFKIYKKMIENVNSEKNILITTNDTNRSSEELYEVADECLILDTSNIDENRGNKLKSISEDLNGELPY